MFHHFIDMKFLNLNKFQTILITKKCYYKTNDKGTRNTGSQQIVPSLVLQTTIILLPLNPKRHTSKFPPFLLYFPYTQNNFPPSFTHFPNRSLILESQGYVSIKTKGYLTKN